MIKKMINWISPKLKTFAHEKKYHKENEYHATDRDNYLQNILLTKNSDQDV